MYRDMYLNLFNAVTDALGEMDQQNYGTAAQLLRAAQQECEEMYLNESEKDGHAYENVIYINTQRRGG